MPPYASLPPYALAISGCLARIGNQGSREGKGKETNLSLTRRVEPVDAKHCLAVEHPEVAIVAGQQAGLAGTNHVVANNVPTGKARGMMSLGKRWMLVAFSGSN